VLALVADGLLALLEKRPASYMMFVTHRKFPPFLFLLVISIALSFYVLPIARTIDHRGGRSFFYRASGAGGIAGASISRRALPGREGEPKE